MVRELPLPLPVGARNLGCRDCRIGDRTRHPELGVVYCASCPVTLRQQTGQPYAIRAR